MTSIFQGKPHKARPFPTKRRVSWVPGVYTLYTYKYSNVPQGAEEHSG